MNPCGLIIYTESNHSPEDYQAQLNLADMAGVPFFERQKWLSIKPINDKAKKLMPDGLTFLDKEAYETWQHMVRNQGSTLNPCGN